MAYDTEVLADNPFLYWKLDETAGSTAADASGNAQDGTYQGDFLLEQSSLINAGNSVLLNDSSTNGTVLINPVSGFPSTAITFEFWIQALDEALFTDDHVFSYNVGGTTQIRLTRDRPGAGSRFYYGFEVNGSLIPFLDGPDPIHSVRQHVVVTWRSMDGRAQLYIQGRLLDDTSGPVSSGFNISDGGAIALAQQQGSQGGTFSAPGNFRIDEFAIYPSVLSASRVDAHFLAGFKHSDLNGAAKQVEGTTPRFGSFPIAEVQQTFFQRVFDTNLSRFVYYTKAEIDPTPAPTETRPNHTGNLDSNTHSVILGRTF